MKGLKDKIGIVCQSLLLVVTATMTLAVVSTNVAAQEITSSLQGTISNPDGQAAAGVTVVITDLRDGTRNSVTANEQGVATFRGLKPGGPYSVRIHAAENLPGYFRYTFPYPIGNQG